MRDWTDSTVVILTCDRDKDIMALCRAGIEKFWPGVNIAVLHDRDYSLDTELPDDVRKFVRTLPYLRKVFDLPYIAPTDQLYCIDSDCLLFSEPTDWGPAMHMGLKPYHDQEEGTRVWRLLGYLFTRNSPRFCGGGWSAKRSEMFEPHRELAIRYVRKCLELGYDKLSYSAVVLEQCLLAGLWRMTYPENLLDEERYPLWRPTENMVLYHLSSAKDQRVGQEAMQSYRKLVGLQ